MTTTLTVGQAAIIAVNTEDNGNPQRDLINVLLLAPVDPGTVIYLTDRAWNGTTFAAAGFGDGTFTYTVPGGGLPAGSVLTITQAQLNAAGFSLSDFGETIYLYQGASANAPTTFLHAIDIADENISSNGILTGTGLSYGTSAVAIGPDNAEFATRTWDIQRGDLFSAINTASHWAQNVNSPQDGTATGSPTNVAPDAQIWVAGSGAGEAIVTINLDGTYNSGNVGYQISQAFQNDPNLFHPSDITLDTVHDRYFFADSDAAGHNRILQGSISQVLNNPGGPLTTTVLYTNAGSDANGIIQSLSVDTTNGIIYFDVGTNANGSTFNKIVANTANQTPTILATLGAEQYITQVAIDYAHNTVLLAVSEISAGFGSDAIFQNYVYKATGLTPSSGTNSLTFTQLPFSPDDTGMGGEGSPLPGEAFPVELGNVRGIDIDPVTQIAYIVTGSASLDNDGNGATTYYGGVYSYALTNNPTGVYNTLYHQNGVSGPPGLLYYIEVDHATGKYYVIDESGTNADPGDGGVYVGSLTVSGTPTLLATVGNLNGLGPRGLEIQHASVLSGSALLATFTEAAGVNTPGVAIAPAGSFQATDADSGGDPNSDELAGAQVRISAGFQSGATHQDVLTINGNTSGSVAQGNGDTISFSYNATTGVLTLSGVSTLDNYEAMLALVRFRVDGDNPTLYGTDTSRTISYATFDGLLYSDEVNASVTVTGTNDAPINVVPGGVTITEDASPGRVFSTANGNALSVSDADADPASQPLQVTLSVGHGTLTLASIAGLSFTAGDGAGDTTMTFTGTANAINAALGAGLTYTATVDYFGADSLSIVTGDQGNTGTGGATSDSDSVSITINGVADIANDTLTINEDAPAANVFVQMNDTFENSNHAITGTTNGTHGIVSINDNNTVGITSDDYVVYTADANYFGPDSFTYTVTSGGATETATVTVTVNAINDAPTATATGANPTYVENATAVTPFSGFAVNAGPNEGSQLFTQLKLTVTNVESGHDALTIGPNTLTLTDGNSSAASGIIATVSLVGTTATVTFTSPGTSAALLQGLINTMGYRYDGENPSSADRVITITSLTDNGGITNGGVDTTTLSLASTVHVTPVNDAPTNSVPGPQSLDEDQSLVINGLSVSDVDAGASPLTVTLAVTHGTLTIAGIAGLSFTDNDGTADRTMTFSGTQAAINAAIAGVTYAPDADFNGGDLLNITTDDGGATGGGAQSAINSVLITVNSVNDAPEGADKSVAIAEDGTYTFALTDFPVTDVENDGLLAVKITTLPANGALLLNGVAVSTGDFISQSDIDAGNLTFVPAPDANGAGYGTFTFQVQDNGGAANGGVDLDQSANTFTINVTAVDDPGIAQDDAFTTDEASAIGAGLSLFADNGSGADSDVDTTLAVTEVNGQAVVGVQLGLASGALLTVNADGTFAYDPNGQFDTLTGVTGATNSSATDSFTYTLAGGETATATITISGLGTDAAFGTAGADTLTGTTGDDKIFGNGGGDTIDGGMGDDKLFVVGTPNHVDGGAGTDILYIQGGTATLGNADVAGIEAVQVYAGASVDLTGVLSGIDTIRSRSTAGGGATIHGTNAGDAILGGAGADTLDGGIGDDQISIYAQPAAVTGGMGSDILYVRGGLAAAFDNSTLSGVETVYVFDGASLDVSAVTTGFTVLRSLSTAAGAATITAGDTADIVVGGLGHDTLSGGGGDDRITVLAQPVHVDGGAGSGDVLVLGGTAPYVFDDTSLTGVERVILRGGVTADLSAVHGAIAINLSGAAGEHSSVIGTADANRIASGAGGDTIDGGGGADVLSGGGGADTFVFTSLADTVGTGGTTDRILDFSHAQNDKIDLAAIDADPNLLGQQQFSFIGSAAFSGGPGYEIRIQAGAQGNSYIQFDTNHDGHTDYSILVHSDVPLTAGSDIVF